MELTTISDFYKNSYVDPTPLGISRFVDENENKTRNLSLSQSKFRSTQLSFTTTHTKLFYPSRVSSKLILGKNKQIYNRIKEIIQKEHFLRVKMMIEEEDKRKKIIEKMPKIRITTDRNKSSMNIQTHIGNSLSRTSRIGSSKLSLITKIPIVPRNSKPKQNSKLLFCNWKIIKHDSACPELREGASLNSVNGKIYLFGGLGRKLCREIATISNPFSFQWDNNCIILENELYPRFNHSSNVYKTDLIIFGGSQMYNKESQLRECLNDMLIFKTETQQMETIKSENESIDPRRNHAACIAGDFLYVHGGINSSGDYLDDLYSFRIGDTRKWVKILPYGESLGKIAYHTCCFLRKNEDINFKEDCIMFFGGRTQEGYVSNRAHLLKFSRMNLKFIIPDISGSPPLPRYGHTMNYLENYNIIAIFGGRNEINFSSTGSVNLNDISIINMKDNLSWSSFQISGSVPIPRYMHCSTSFDNFLLVFGGLSNHSFCQPFLSVLEINDADAEILQSNNEGFSKNQNQKKEKDYRNYRKNAFNEKSKGKILLQKLK